MNVFLPGTTHNSDSGIATAVRIFSLRLGLPRPDSRVRLEFPVCLRIWGSVPRRYLEYRIQTTPTCCRDWGVGSRLILKGGYPAKWWVHLLKSRTLTLHLVRVEVKNRFTKRLYCVASGFLEGARSLPKYFHCGPNASSMNSRVAQ